MPKGYIIARVTVDDNDAYMHYAAGARIAMAKYGARILVLGGQHTALDGAARPRNVVLEFESFERRRRTTTPPATRRRASTASPTASARASSC